MFSFRPSCHIMQNECGFQFRPPSSLGPQAPQLSCYWPKTWHSEVILWQVPLVSKQCAISTCLSSFIFPGSAFDSPGKPLLCQWPYQSSLLSVEFKAQTHKIDEMAPCASQTVSHSDCNNWYVFTLYCFISSYTLSQVLMR